jgi:hypothetical protein
MEELDEGRSNRRDRVMHAAAADARGKLEVEGKRGEVKVQTRPQNAA